MTPLYTYSPADCPNRGLFDNKEETQQKQFNINPKLLRHLSELYGVAQTFLSERADKNVCATDGTLKITRRNLPHWTMKGATYFITFRIADGELTIEEQKLVLNHIIAGDKKFYELIAAIVMPDHIHLIITPGEGYELSRIMKGIKGGSARKVNILRRASGSIWHDESFDRIVRNAGELDEKLNYMLNNPVKKGLTENPWRYHGWHFNEKYFSKREFTKADKREGLSHHLFYYIYSILYSNIYRTKYAEFLRRDFPRIPFVSDYNAFKEFAGLGKKLVDLHLLNSKALDRPNVKFYGDGKSVVDKPKLDLKKKSVYINKTKYFKPVSQAVWEYQIGGYQVMSKWLKDRKNRDLSLDETSIYCKIAAALQKTIEIQKEIDSLYKRFEKEV